MNKKIRILGIFLYFTVAFSFVSCNDYLDVTLLDQLTQDETFSKRVSTEQYLAHVYSYLPREYEYLEEGSAVPRSDEAMFSWYQWVNYLSFNNGSWGPSTPNYNIWKAKYTGIKQASIFMNHVDECLEIDSETRRIMKAEARFLRAYYYFELFRQYGPVYIWGDIESDELIKPETIDRHTVDENVNFIAEEYDKAIAELPAEISDFTKWAGRITKGAAMAAKARLMLYAASPLYNGCDLYKGQMKNLYGDFLFPQSPDPQKWEKAAKAAKDVIDMNIYELYKDQTEADPLLRAIKSYQGVLFEEWNKETIWGAWGRNPTNTGLGAIGFYLYSRCMPPRVCELGVGGFCPSLKLVDTYPMAKSGRYPVTGYDNNGNPVIDKQSGYTNTGFTENFKQPGASFAPGFKAHNSCVGRDARFYASVFPNGFYWINQYKGIKQVTFFTGGSSSFLESGDCVKVGYLWRRPLDPALNTESGSWGTVFWPYFRLAEIYLDYAEACNEKPERNETEALKYINLVRERSGLNALETAYPEVKGNKDLLRMLIQKERMVELAFEGHRYYDARRWMIAQQEFPGPEYSLNLLATSYEDSWSRTSNVWKGGPRVFEPKHYFFPINQEQLSEMKNITQNYGW